MDLPKLHVLVHDFYAFILSPFRLCFWFFSTVFRTALFTISYTCSIKCTTNDMVTYPWKVFYTSTTDKHNTVFLQVMSDTWNVSSNFNKVAQTYTSKFTKGRVRFFRCHSSNTSCNTTFLWCR